MYVPKRKGARKRTVCPVCNGKKEVLIEGAKAPSVCPRCDGRGYINV